jgi:uncharacterized protein YdcH (DUF465 family)
MKRSAAPPGSLELLLDTMCNAFGGVMFIAMLLAVLLQQSAPSESSPPVTAPADAAEYARLLRKQNELSHDIDDLKSRLARHRNLRELWDDPRLKQLDSLRRENDELDRKVKEAERRREDLDVQLAASGERRRKAEQEIAKREADLQSPEPAASPPAPPLPPPRRLPVWRPAFKPTYWMIVKGGRLFLCDRIGPNGPERNQAHESVVVLNIHGGWEYTVRPDRGQPAAEVIRQAAEDQGYGGKILRGIDKNRYTLQFAVYPDSYDSFLSLRDFFDGHGYDYDWHPMESADKPLFLQPGGSGVQ